MLGVDAEHTGEFRKRTGKIQLITGPGNVAVAEVFQVIVNPRGYGHSGVARGNDPVVFSRPELTHIQAVIREAPINYDDELSGSVPQQASQQLDHSSALCLVASLRLQVIQSGKFTRSSYAKVEHDNDKQAAITPARHFDPYDGFPTADQV